MGRAPDDLRKVVAGLLADRRLLAACAERDMGTLFRLLNHRGISTRRIAAAVDIGQGRLYEYMNGKSRVEKLAVFEQIADALHIPGHLLGLARRSWEPNAPATFPVAAPVAPVAPAAPTADDDDDDDMAAVDAFRYADRQTGGGRLYLAVARHLSENIGPRLVDADSGPQTFAVAAALTEMAGWMAHDSGRDGLAGRHFGRALALARASGDTPLTAGIAASNSHLALQTGDPSAAVHWARSGLDTAAQGPLIPALVVRLHAMSARALAAAGHPTQALHALDQAEKVLGHDSEADLPWLSPFDAAALATESALVLNDLERYDHAQTSAERAIRLREAARVRSLVFNRITLATVHVRRRDLDSAVAVGHDLLAADPNLGSVRVIRQLDRLRSRLEPHGAHPPVRAFLSRFDDARRARMLLLADIIPPAPRRHHPMRPTPANPEAWNAYLAEGNASQARKRVSADVLLRDAEGRVLIVKPTYKPGWDLPGGMAEANESPDDAARRELKEELGLDVALRGLLVVDWVPPHGPWDDQIAFIFDGGTLSADQATALRPQDGELAEARLVPPDQAIGALRERLRNRFRAALSSCTDSVARYLHDGRS